MSEPIVNTNVRPFTADSFYKYLSEKKFMAVRSKTTQAMCVPPHAIIPHTPINEMEWVELSGKGQLAGFTIIYVGPSFMNNAGFNRDNPYVSGIVKLDEGLSICARITGVNAKDPSTIQIGMPLAVDFLPMFDGKSNKTLLCFKPEVQPQTQPASAPQDTQQATVRSQRLKGKVALITGGAAGIGKATAERFANEGAQVVICDVNETIGQEVVKTLGASASFYKVNVANRQEVQAWVEAVYNRYQRIDILVNNAGITRDNQLVKYKDGVVVKQMPEADFDLVIAVNLKGTFNCTQAVAPFMMKQNGGVILNASSLVGEDGNFGQTNYVATKAGVIGMMKVWMRELGKYNIRINTVAPGFTATDILSTMPEKVLQDIRNHTPLSRLGNPTDIANAYLFLASDEAAFITGAVLRVDGGTRLGT